MSTASPQLIHSLLTVAALLFTLVSGACAFYVARQLRSLQTMKLDLSELFERQEALTDRFTRFQKREGMRATREEKTSQQDALEQAKAIIAANASPSGQSGNAPGSKADLYRRRQH